MTATTNQHLGNDFEDFLADEGLLDSANAIAVKRVLAWQIEQAMKEKKISKSRMAELMHTSRAALDRLLDTTDASLTLATLTKAANALGKRVEVQLV
jgi:predicted XRE-type DNA-binding protein